MSENSNKDKNETLTFDEFKKNDTKFLEDRYNRYRWTVQEWNRIMGRGIIRPPHIEILYYEGSNAFFHGFYTASILTITATIELTLKAIVDLSLMPSKQKKGFKNVINEAVKQKIISSELSEELHFLRRNTRNVISHDVDMALQMTVGWEKDPTSTTRYMLTDERLEKLANLQRDSQESLFVSREVFARETIQLLIKLFHSCIVSGKEWSNLVKL